MLVYVFGIAEYFGIDPTIIRLLWVISVLLQVQNIIVYSMCVGSPKPENNN